MLGELVIGRRLAQLGAALFGRDRLERHEPEEWRAYERATARKSVYERRFH